MPKDVVSTRARSPPTLAPLRVLCASALLLACGYFLTRSLAVAILVGGLRSGPWTYNAGEAAITWFDTGFARRELAGTIIRLFTSDPLSGSVWFSIVTYSLFAIWATWIISRPGIRAARRVALSAALLAIVVRLSYDLGRTDAAIMFLGGVAALCARDGRWTICAALVFVALLIHETGLIELGPIVAAVSLASGSWRSWRSQAAARGAIILVAAVAAYAVSFHPHFDLPAVAARVHGEFIDPQPADSAVYMNLVGGKALGVAMCMAHQLAIYPVEMLDAVVLAALFSIGLNAGHRRVAILATVAPALVLSLIALDIGRWAVFGAYGAFVLGALLPQRPTSAAREWASAGVAIIACLMMSDYGRPLGAQEAIPWVEAYVGENWLQPWRPTSMERCDPHWRHAIGLN